MKKLFFSMLLFTITMQSQTGLITYSESFDNFSNPERGFYKPTTTRPSGTTSYVPLDPDDVDDAITDGSSLIWRVFRLDDFKNELNPNSNAAFTIFKTNMAADFQIMRDKGVKCIIRFCYTNDEPTPLQPNLPDASMAVILAQIASLRSVTVANADVISSIEAGFIGSYGEWAYSGNFGNSGSLNATNIANRITVGRAIVGLNVTNGLTFNRKVAFRTPYYQQLILNTLPVLTTYTKGRISGHNDCFLYDINDNGTFTSSPISLDQIFLAAQSGYNFTGGETCRNAIPNDSFYSRLNTINDMEKYHFNYLNGYPYVNPNVSGTSPLVYWATLPGDNGNFLEEVKRKLGYRFVLKTSSVTNNTLNIVLRNVGFANLFNARSIYLILKKNVSPFTEYSKLLLLDPNNAQLKGEILFVTPLTGVGVPNGTYDLFLRYPDSNSALATDSRYSIRFANNQNYTTTTNGVVTTTINSLPVWDPATGYNNLYRQVTINGNIASRIKDSEDDAIFQVSSYPNPFATAFRLDINTSSEARAEFTLLSVVLVCNELVS